MLEITKITETGAAYRTPAAFFDAYAKKRISGLSNRLDHIVLIEHDATAGRATFATTSGGSWPYNNDFHAAQAVFEVAIIGVRDESLEELADLAVVAALEWEHSVVLDGTLQRDFDLVGQLWSALMPLLKREHPEEARRLEQSVMNVKIERLCFEERKGSAACEPRAPYMQLKVGDCVISFNRHVNEGQVLEALRAAEAYMQETA